MTLSLIIICRKLIGARYFYKGYQAAGGIGPFNSARDYEGHGSHTLSTAGGNFVDGASVFGNGNGTARGGSPKARVATYKVCWPPIWAGECFEADILAAFDAAISDGVDVLSLSLGGSPQEFFESGLSVGSFHAVANGITVVFSAGNSGPDPETVTNVEPWVFTVAASTIDREFNNYVTLGDKKVLKVICLSHFFFVVTLKPIALYAFIDLPKAATNSNQLQPIFSPYTFSYSQSTNGNLA